MGNESNPQKDHSGAIGPGTAGGGVSIAALTGASALASAITCALGVISALFVLLLFTSCQDDLDELIGVWEITQLSHNVSKIETRSVYFDEYSDHQWRLVFRDNGLYAELEIFRGLGKGEWSMADDGKWDIVPVCLEPEIMFSNEDFKQECMDTKDGIILWINTGTEYRHFLIKELNSKKLVLKAGDNGYNKYYTYYYKRVKTHK